MSAHVERTSAWVYRGIWAILVRWFRVPDRPPTLPVPAGETLASFRPAEGFLRYLKFMFWLTLFAVSVPILVGWTAVMLTLPWLGAVLAIPLLLLEFVPCVIGYIAIHLRYDSTWYVMTSRSLRIRRGIWTIHETTITFENVQNVTVTQGPVERWFGIGNVRVDTAGGGGKSAGQHGSIGGAAGHRGLIEGVSDAPRIRDLILARLKPSASAGLGDEEMLRQHGLGWSPAHVTMLREIRDLVISAPPLTKGG